MNIIFGVPLFSLVFLGSTFGFIPSSDMHPQSAPPGAEVSTRTNPSLTHTYHYEKPGRTSTRPTRTTTTPAPTPPTTAPVVTPSSDIVSALETAIHEKINVERVAKGLQPLGVDTRLVSIARAHSKDMLTNNYFAHTNQSGCSSSCRYKNAGYAYRSMGENIYMMNGYTLSATEVAEKVVQGWMNSSGHRANILNASYTTEGVGVAIEGKKIYVTENLALPR